MSQIAALQQYNKGFVPEILIEAALKILTGRKSKPVEKDVEPTTDEFDVELVGQRRGFTLSIRQEYLPFTFY